jgi:hypothetical protein
MMMMLHPSASSSPPWAPPVTATVLAEGGDDPCLTEVMALIGGSPPADAVLSSPSEVEGTDA